MQLSWTPPQADALVASSSFLLMGPAGSGKTTCLLAKAQRLAASGQRVVLSAFAFRVLENLKQQGQPDLTPHIATGQLKFGTLYDLASAQLTKAGVAVQFASNNHVRGLLRQLMAEQGFSGTLEEAEHIIRAAKGKAKKLPEADKFYGFVKAYQALLDRMGLSDRHDVIRRHVLGMKDGSVPPLACDWLLLDGLQDASELQMIWLQMHLAKGVRLALSGDDDVTAFGRDGALGASAIQQAQGWAESYELDVFTLPASHRLSTPLAAVLAKQARMLRVRMPKSETTVAAPSVGGPGVLPPLGFQAFLHKPTLHAAAVALVKDSFKQGLRVGVITRHDFDAAVLTHLLQKEGLNPASYARLIWEEPTPQVVLASLHLLLGQSSAAHITLLLLGLGLPAADVVRWQQTGVFAAPDWLPSGAPLPLEGITSPTTQTLVQQVRWALRAAYKIWASQTLPPPAVFKALWADLLPLLPAAEQPAALLALEMLLSLQGKLSDVLPRVVQETMPDMACPVVVGPVREMRNHQFDVVIIVNPAMGVWPPVTSPLLGADHDHERRLWLLACSRARQSVVVMVAGDAGALASEFKQIAKL